MKMTRFIIKTKLEGEILYFRMLRTQGLTTEFVKDKQLADIFNNDECDHYLNYLLDRKRLMPNGKEFQYEKEEVFVVKAIAGGGVGAVIVDEFEFIHIELDPLDPLYKNNKEKK